MLDQSELQRLRASATFGVLGRASCDLLFGHIDALEAEAERLRAELREIAERARVGRYDITEIAESALAGTEDK